MKNQHVENLSQLFRVLSDQTRLRLVVVLKEAGEQHVTWLCKKLRLPQPTVSHHLGLLRAHGLVKNRRAGKQVFYSVDSAKFNRIAELANSLFAVA